MDIGSKLASTVTQFDMQQSTKRGYNRNALGLYLGAVDLVVKDIDNGVSIRDAIVAQFNGRLLDRCLKAVGLATSTKSEQIGSLTGPRL